MYLQRLAVQPLPASQLARDSDLSVQEAMRHLARLQEAGMVARSAGRAYALTPFGVLVAARLPYFETLGRDAAFYSDHDVSFVPTHLALTPLVLAARSTAGEADHRRHVASLFATPCREFRYLGEMNLDWPPAGGSTNPEVGTSLWAALGLAADVLQGRVLRPPFHPEGAPPSAAVKLGILPALPFVLCATEREAVLFLRQRGGPVDFSIMLHGEDGFFLRWAETLFQAMESRSVRAFDSERGDAWKDWTSKAEAAARTASTSGQDLSPRPSPTA